MNSKSTEIIIHKPEMLKPETLAALVRAGEVAKKQYSEIGGGTA